MSKIEELKINAGVNDNPDQEGLNLFADMVITEYKERAKEHILGILNPQVFAEKVEELKTTAGLSDNLYQCIRCGFSIKNSTALIFEDKPS